MSNIKIIIIIGIAMGLLYLGYGIIKTQSIVPELQFNDVSTASQCGEWSSTLTRCYTGTSGWSHCYHTIYYKGVEKTGYIYSSDDNGNIVYSDNGDDGNIIQFISTGNGGQVFKYKCAIPCIEPYMSYNNPSISQTGLASIQVTLNSGKLSQNIDMYNTQVYAYTGIEWIDISSQIDPTILQSQMTTLKWQIIEGETGKVKTKLTNTCGYSLVWKESESILYEFVEDDIVEDDIVEDKKTFFDYIINIIEWFKHFW